MTAETIPILPSSSFDETAAFYKRLGFLEKARYPGEYLILSHPIGIELHFWSNDALTSATNDAGCYVRFTSAAEAQALYDEWARSGLEWSNLRRPEDPGYNLLEFALLDCHRNLLRIGGFIEAPV